MSTTEKMQATYGDVVDEILIPLNLPYKDHLETRHKILMLMYTSGVQL